MDNELLETQLALARSHFLSFDESVAKELDLLKIIDEVKKLPVAYSEVLKVLQIFATLPVTVASNERFFSVLKHVKSYLRTTMTDERLCDLMIIAVEQKTTKELPLDGLVDDFAAMRPRRYPLLH